MKHLSAPRAWSVSPAWQRRLPVVLPFAVYLLLVLGGITNSNIGVAELRQDPAHPYGAQIGHPEEVRRDEFMTESPLWLGQMAVGSGDAVNPLSVSPDFFAQLPDGPVSSIVFFDGTLMQLGPWLPDAMLFAAKWWLPTLLLGIGMPIWFRQVTGKLRWGYLAAFLTVLAPASMWWSGRPVNTLGFMFAGCALGMYASNQLERGRRLNFLLAIIVAAILLARFPTYYQPLAIVLGFPVVLATAAFIMLGTQTLRTRVLALGGLALASTAATGALLFENLPAIRAGLDTVFPGQRKSTGSVLPIERVFGATDLGFLKTTDAQLVATNATEIATSFTVLAVVLLVLHSAQRWRGDRRSGAAFWTMFGCTLFWLSWSTVDYGALGTKIPLANLVPAIRAANGVGFLAVIAFCLFMSQWQPVRRVATAVAAGGTAAFISAWAGSSFQANTMPLLTTRMIWVSALLTGLVVFALVAWPRRLSPLIIAGSFAALMVFRATPLEVGLADLRASPTAAYFMSAGEAARSQGKLWVSDSAAIDSLMLATGTPALSSRQQIGPDRQQWERLDPGGVHESIWNRGGTYINFEWSTNPDIEWRNPNADVILMTTSPCTVARRVPELHFVVSHKPLTDACVTLDRTLQWSGQQQWIYTVN